MKNSIRLASGRATMSDWWVAAIAAAAGALVVAWPMPGVIALRNFLLGVLLAVLFVHPQVRAGLVKACMSARWVLLAYCGLLFWALVVAFIVSEETAVGLDSLRSQWLRASAALAIGLGLGYTDLTDVVRRRFWLAIIFALLAHPFMHVVFALWLALFGGGIPPEYSGLMDHRANITYVNLIAASFVIGDLVSRAASMRPLFPSLWASLFLLGVIATSALLAATRNGVLSLIALMSLAGVMGLFASGLARKYKILIATSLMGLICIYGWVAVQMDSRWERFVQTVPVALDIDGERSWINTDNQPLPLAADGMPIEITAYERIAWARAGARLTFDYPFGTGLGVDAFKVLVNKHYGKPRAAHSHNAYVDLALDVGLPGLALCMIFFGGAVLWAWRAAQNHGNSYGVVLILLIAAFASRAFLDNIFRVHIIEELLFFVGFLMGLLSAGPLNEPKRAS